MAYTHKVYDRATAQTSEVEAGKGVTLYIGSKTYQVMSDIWEQGSYAVYWDGTAIRVQDWIEKGEVDATPEIWVAAKAWKREQLYERHLGNLQRTHEEAAQRIVRGAKARVVRGRKFPIGMEGEVVGLSQSQWGTNVGIATSDVKVEVEKNGRKFLNHRDVAWVAIRNVERIDTPIFDAATAMGEAAKFADAAVAKNHWVIPS